MFSTSVVLIESIIIVYLLYMLLCKKDEINSLEYKLSRKEVELENVRDYYLKENKTIDEFLESSSIEEINRIKNYCHKKLRINNKTKSISTKLPKP